MSKFSKACAILIPIGFVISIVGGVIMAASPQPIDYDNDSNVAYTSTDVTSVIEDSDNTKTFGQDEADSIVLNCTAANISFHKGEEYSINSDSFFGSDLSLELKDGVVYVNYNKENITDFDSEEINIGIPRSCKSIKIKCNAGDINIEDFLGNIIDISIDCGNVNISNCSVSESCKINNTLGNVYAFSSKLSNFEAKLISGNLDVYYSILSGTNKAEVDVGNAEFTLDGYPSDYSINAKVKVGEIDCDYNLDDYTNSDNTIDISVLAGNCSIEYYDND